MIRLALLLAVAVITATQTGVLLLAMDGGITAEDDWKTPRAEFIEVPSEFEIESADLVYQFADIAQQEPEFAYLLLLEAGVDADLALHLVSEASDTASVTFPD